jgi:signal transduction histidine kinase
LTIIWLAGVIPAGARAWVLDHQGWVLAGAGAPTVSNARLLTWAERTLYRLVAGNRTAFHGERNQQALRLDESLTGEVLDGQEVQHWEQDPESAMVRSTVAVPIRLGERLRGAVVMEASMDGLLLVTNRALGRLLLATLLVTVLLTAGLWWFATRLSRRVRRLSTAVSQAMDDAGHPRALPLTADRDELGDLARNNTRLLRAVADYTGYLQKLASRLSHELRTPLAITRSSLDNLASQPLDAEAQTYVSRAREGLDRQAAIVRAMSEATRLEAAVRAAEWEQADLVALLRQAADGYRAIHEGRDIRVLTPVEILPWHCAPDLLVQALDKLVDNAVSLTGPEDTITLALEPGGSECVLAVRNQGSRLPATLHEQLFDSLVSLREGGEAGRHLGLGLHIVRLVAEAHHGRVQASNLPDGQGVEFRITLPAAS